MPYEHDMMKGGEYEQGQDSRGDRRADGAVRPSRRRGGILRHRLIAAVRTLRARHSDGRAASNNHHTNNH